MAGYHQDRDGSLSNREREVLELMAKGLTNGQIAERLDIAFDTAKSHVSAVIGKLGVDTREEAVRLWRQEQRVGARFSRAMRGMVVGVGLGKVAAGVGGLAAVTAGVAVGAAVLLNGSGDDGPVLAASATASPTATIVPATPTLDLRTPENMSLATSPSGPVYVMGTIEFDGEILELVIYESAGFRWCQGIRQMTIGCGFAPPGDPRLQTGVGGSIGGPGLWSGSTTLETSRVELILADGTIVEAEMFDSPRGLGFEIRYWLAVVERSADVVETRALAADGSVLETTGEWPAGEPHIIRYDQVDYNVNFDTFAGPGDPIFQRLPTADSTGMRFSVEGAPVELAFTIEHEGGSTIEVRYRCDAGPGGVPPEVRYDEPRGAGGSGRFVLNVAEGATLCDWFVTKWDGNFRIRSAD